MELKSKSDILKIIPGIGDIVAFELLILLPELGSLNRREIASLAGVALVANDRGRQQGYRRTGHGGELKKSQSYFYLLCRLGIVSQS